VNESQGKDQRIFSTLLGLMDVSNIFIGGHSFGAATAILASQDPDIAKLLRACFIHDIWAFSLPTSSLEKEVKLPLFSILSEQFVSWDEVEYAQRLLKNKTNNIYGSFYLQGTKHQNFSDAVHWYPSWIVKVLQLSGDLNIERGREIIVNATANFLLGQIKKDSDKTTSKDVSMGALQKKYPELRSFGITQEK